MAQLNLYILWCKQKGKVVRNVSWYDSRVQIITQTLICLDTVKYCCIVVQCSGWCFYNKNKVMFEIVIVMTMVCILYPFFYLSCFSALKFERNSPRLLIFLKKFTQYIFIPAPRLLNFVNFQPLLLQRHSLPEKLL